MLGVIFVGIATPVEAAGIGTFGALFVSALHRRLNWPAVQEAAIATLKATAMVMWIFFGATMFVGFFIVKGGQTFVANTILGTGLPPYGILALMMVILFVLGMFIDWVGILLLTVPIFLPIMKSLEWGGLFGFPGVRTEDVPLWYGVIFMVNMQMAFLSPPFGYSLFYLKSVAPPEITMATIFRAAVNFMALQWLGRRPVHCVSPNRALASEYSLRPLERRPRSWPWTVKAAQRGAPAVIEKGPKFTPC